MWLTDIQKSLNRNTGKCRNCISEEMMRTHVEDKCVVSSQTYFVFVSLSTSQMPSEK